MDILNALDIQAWTLRDPETYGFVNAAHAAFIGRSAADVSGTRLADVWGDADEPEWRRARQQANDERCRTQCLVTLPDAMGRMQRLAVLHVPLDATQEKDATVLCTASRQMVAESWATEHRRIARQAELRRCMSAVGRLAGSTAHELNNNLAVIVGYLDLMLAQWPSEAMGRSYVRHMQSASRAAAASLVRLLHLGGRAMLYPSRQCLDAIIRRVLQQGDSPVGEGHRVETALEAPDAEIQVDPDFMADILRELLRNAVEASPDGGRIWISTRVVSVAEASVESAEPTLRQVDHLRVCIEDDGPGFPNVSDPAMIEPFVTSKDPGRHRGMGLSLTYGLILGMGGGIQLQNRREGGARIVLLLPLADLSSRLPEPHLEQPVSPEGREPSARGRVLLVDDDPDVRTIFSKALRRAGYVVDTAASGDEAIDRAYAAGAPYDLLLVDMVMPGRDGRSTWRRLRRDFPRLRAILVTGYSEGMSATDILADGFSRVLTKPVPMDVLVQAVAAYMPAHAVDTGSDD